MNGDNIQINYELLLFVKPNIIYKIEKGMLNTVSHRIIFNSSSAKKPIVLFMLGGPGCGKGTQSAKI